MAYKFEPNRVPHGTIDAVELGRRLCYNLQLPNRFSTRVIRAINETIYDALLHHEGIRIDNVGILYLKRYPSDTCRGIDTLKAKRTTMYKLAVHPYPSFKETLRTITAEERENESKV